MGFLIVAWHDYSLTSFARDPVWGDSKENGLADRRQDYSLISIARDPDWGDSKEKALPRCAWLRSFFIHTLMQVKPATL